MTENQEVDESATEVSVSFGEITEDDLGLNSEDIQQLLVAPTDWTIGVLIDLLKKGKIDLQPNYQRRIAWGEEKMSRFIESLFMRLPVPQIVLAEMKPGVFAVIDGKQRMNSLARFCIDEQLPLRLDNCEYRKDLNQKIYDDLLDDSNFEPSVDAFQSHTIRTVVLKNWKNDNLLYLLFLRLNQNSVTLSPQELRRALFPGDFMNWLDDKTAISPAMELIFNKVPDFRMRDMEIGTRYLAFNAYSSSYAGNMKKFLDDTSKIYKNNFQDNFVNLELAWENFEFSMSLTKSIFGKNAFKSRIGGDYQRSVNRAVIDIMSYYFSFPEVRDLVDKNCYPAIKLAFENLCDQSETFLRSIQTSTKTARATSQRFHDWGDALRVLLGNAVPIFPLPRNPAE